MGNRLFSTPERQHGPTSQEHQQRHWEAKSYNSLQQAAAACQKPLYLKETRYEVNDGQPGLHRHSRVPQKRHVFLEPWRISGPIIVRAVICLILPLVIFLWTLTVLSFSWHFHLGDRIWPIALIPPGVAIAVCAWSSFNNYKLGLDMRWSIAMLILFVISFVAGVILGDANYKINLQTFYFYGSLKSYSNISPTAVSGQQIMDAGRVQFKSDSRVLIDMGMSFTIWDTYCVAPIGSDSMASGQSLASYDMWAVGKNCCSASNPTFACGEYQNMKAKSGLRQTNENERFYFNLAVQQAEAAYNIKSDHPIFFYWVQDADATMQEFFASGFRVWVLFLFTQMALNSFIVLMLVNAFKHPVGSLFHDDEQKCGHAGHGHHH